VLAEAKAGMLNQALALAQALGLSSTTPPLRRLPWLELLPQSLWASQRVLGWHGLTPPWPTRVISSGRYAARLSAALRRHLPELRNCHIQDPRGRYQDFDIIVTPLHDPARGANIITTRGALHSFSAERLAAEARAWRSRIDKAGRPLLAVLVGGPTRHLGFPDAAVGNLIEELQALARHGQWSLALSTSRRTPPRLIAAIQGTLAADCSLCFTGEGENPYAGLLGLADALLVTADSVNMVTEALATGRPVHVWGEPRPGSRLQRFLQQLLDDGLVRNWTGQPEAWPYPPLYELPGVAREVAERWALPRVLP
jgi:uncharacterized protein